MDTKAFNALSLTQRWQQVQTHGTPVAKRSYRGFDVQLYALHAIYAEVWRRAGLSMIEWIEVMPIQRVADVYGADLTDLHS